jgi:hypothetical protein
LLKILEATFCKKWIKPIYLEKTPIFSRKLAKIDEKCDITLITLAMLRFKKNIFAETWRL